MMFANRISSSTSCSIWLPETSPPSSSRGVLRHRFQSCNTSLPIGVQFIAAMNREDLLFRLAAQLEGEVRWSERLPTIHAAV